ncbi:MAG TPA: ATP-binding protein [Candidatus Sulfotelmatobacter sp.]|nr:ATP-binding protein [Candidatus Sulfotelmatobacter sp.]
MSETGYVVNTMGTTRATTSELRLPADPSFILVAKRAAAAFATIAEFPIEAVDDLVIAVAQACDNAIACSDRAVGKGRGQLRLVFALEGHRLEVKVNSACSRSDIAAMAAQSARPAVVATGQAAEPVAAEDSMRPSVTAQRKRAAEKRQVMLEESLAEDPEAGDLALRLMSLFVDDCRYRMDHRTGGLRVRLTKYRAS